jgi:GNAT superfamily N-acetyltransferase
MFAVKWEAGLPPRTFPGIYPDDFVISPDHRNRGLMTKIMKAALNDLADKGYPYIYNLSAGPVTFLGSLAMGWKNAGSFQPYHIRSARAERFQRVRDTISRMRFLRRFADQLPFRRWVENQQPLQGLRKRLPRSIRKGDSRIIVDRVARPEDMATLIARIEYDGRIRHVRDREYLSWRFRNPLHRYLFLYWEKEALEGYLVLQEYVSEFSNRMQVNIVDWEGTSPHVRTGLLRAAIDQCPFADLNIWTATLGEDTKDLLRGTGFRSSQKAMGMESQPPCLLVRSVRDDALDAEWSLSNRRLPDMANWDLRMIYSMQG